ncbi:MAG: polyphosphate:AMP phosphotransferase [Holophagae bacterium]|jgi:polyphosphate:AMP phosphotransferase
MFDAIEPEEAITAEDYEAAVPRLRGELVSLQHRMRLQGAQPVMIVVSGLNCAGRSEIANLLNEWMDPRFVATEAYWAPSDDERARPPFWRYWRDLPPNGRIGLFLHAWYTRAAVERFSKKLGKKAFRRHLERVVTFESLLAADGVELVKLWMHLDRKHQRRRLDELEKDPLQRWRVGELERELSRRYGRYQSIAAEAVERTSTAAAPWIVVDGSDRRSRDLFVGRTVRDALRRQVEPDRAAHRSATGRPDTDDAIEIGNHESEASALAALDMTRKVSKKHYTNELAKLQRRINRLARRAREDRLPVVAIFEGWDAAGKGGAVRRLTAAMDVRDYRVIPIAAPSDEERAHHYLWRFWRHLGRAGRMTIFDRSWYGRVLVERVEGFAAEPEWRRAYDEIVDFEEQLVDFGAVMLKFWIHVTPDEQLRRFEKREATPYKRWKLTDEDWRNRKKWDQYETAVDDMVARTSTGFAPWTLVEGNSKKFARLKVLRTVADALEGAFGRDG